VVELVETTFHRRKNSRFTNSRSERMLPGMPFTYILRCADGSLYVGSTRGDIQLRVAQHNAGTGAVYTACRRPVELVWSAEFERVTEAFALEKRVQNWSRAKRLALIEGRYADLPALSRSKRP
jgi:putative endonuclease